MRAMLHTVALFALSFLSELAELIVVIGAALALVFPIFTIGVALQDFWPITTILFVAVFTIKAVHAGRLNASLSIAGLVAYGLSWLLVPYGSLVSLLVWGAGMVMWFTAFYWSLMPSGKAALLNNIRSNWNLWLMGVGVAQFLPWVAYMLATSPGYYAVRTTSSLTMSMMLASGVVAIASIISAIAIDSKVRPYRGEA